MSEDATFDLSSPSAPAAALARRPDMYVGIREPSAEQWRLILDSMSLSVVLAGDMSEVLTAEDRELMRRDDLGQDEDVLIGLLAKIISALHELPGRAAQGTA